MGLFSKKPKDEVALGTEANQGAVLEQKIGEKEVARASEILRKYKEGKQKLEQKIIANEEFWKLRQWNRIDSKQDGFRPATAWLWTCIMSRLADVMDSYPTCNFRAKQRDDVGEAKVLSSIVPVILEENDFEKTYHDVALYTLKQGGGVYGIFWDSSKHNGLGDIAIKKIDFINLFWESGVTDIQESANVFTTELVDKEILEQRYPQCRGRLGGNKVTLAKYLYDDTVDTSKKAVVVDWYYHTEYNGKKVLHYCKYVNNIVLYATENETTPPMAQEQDPITGEVVDIPIGMPLSERGWYDHGLYPFVVQPLFPIEGSLCGYGLTDIGKDAQIQIDLLNKAITDNAISGAVPRYFAKNNGGINMDDFTDLSKQIIRVDGSVNDDNIRPIDVKSLNGLYLTVLNNKIDELKYCTANQDVNNGSTPSGVTSASGISALQETAGKNARCTNKAFHRAYKDVIYQVVELLRQFYNVPRQFRIVPDAMTEEYISYSNEKIKGQAQGMVGMDMGMRTPEFDIEVSIEKANPYKKVEINDLALQFYKLGFFNPQFADQSMSCLKMMDFDHKEDIMQMINQNAMLNQRMLQYQQLCLQLAQKYEPQLANQLAQGIMTEAGQPIASGSGQVSETSTEGEEHPFVERSRARARASTEAE